MQYHPVIPTPSKEGSHEYRRYVAISDIMQAEYQSPALCVCVCMCVSIFRPAAHVLITRVLVTPKKYKTLGG
jgi:hypothetical protein